MPTFLTVLRSAMLALCLAPALHAQSTSDAAADLTFRVVVPLTQTTLQQLAFAKVGPGVPKIIPVADARAGLVRFDGEHLMDAQVTFVAPLVLTNQLGATLPFEATAAYYANIGDIPIALALDGTNLGGGFFAPSQLKIGSNARNGELTAVGALTGLSGSLFLALGGTVTPAGSQARGAYAGDVLITLQYLGM